MADIALNALILIAGLALLVKGSDKFVSASSRIAKRFGVSDFFIGLTLVAVGTSLPELAAALFAIKTGASSLVVGNLIGSNIANIGLVIGIAALMGSIVTREEMLKRDGYIMLLIVLLFVSFAANGTVSAFEGVILLLFYFAYILFLLQGKEEREKKLQFDSFLEYFFKFKYLLTIKTHAVKIFTKRNHKPAPKTVHEKQATEAFKEGLVKNFLVVIISLTALIYGAKLVIDNALVISSELGIAESFIGLSLIAIGTSLPELSVAINAVRKGFGGIVIGNVIGSNIANLALVFAITSTVAPVSVSIFSLTYLIPAMVLFSIVFLMAVRNEWKIKRKEGIGLLITYVLFLLFMFFKANGGA